MTYPSGLGVLYFSEVASYDEFTSVLLVKLLGEVQRYSEM